MNLRYTQSEFIYWLLATEKPEPELDFLLYVIAQGWYSIADKKILEGFTSTYGSAYTGELPKY